MKNQFIFKETKKSKCEAPQVITSYNYPPLSKHQQQLHSQDRITRLTKSADSLRGILRNFKTVIPKRF